MRLQEIYCICRNTQESWFDLSYDEVKTGGNTYYKVKNPNGVRAILSQLDAIKLFVDDISKIRNLSAGLVQPSGDIVVDQRIKNALSAEYLHLGNKVVTITQLFESVNYRQESNGFDIKLPPDISLPELSKCAKDLDTIFSTCRLFADETSTITFSAVDVGSVWLSFLVGGASVAITLRAIAELVDKALVIRSHHLTTKEQEEKIRSLSLGNDLLEHSIEINKSISKGLMERVCTELSEEHDIQNPEDKQRVKHALQLLSDWMCKGMEIYPSVLAPSETKAVFPPIEKQALPERVVSLLTEGRPTDIG